MTEAEAAHRPQLRADASFPGGEAEGDPHAAEGLYYRVRCGQCDMMFEVEEDPRSNVIVCDLCGYGANVEGDY